MTHKKTIITSNILFVIKGDSQVIMINNTLYIYTTNLGIILIRWEHRWKHNFKSVTQFKTWLNDPKIQKKKEKGKIVELK